MSDLRLIVNADDYGRTPGVSQGIRKAHLEGIVTSTTALMNMPGVDEALGQVLVECPNLGLGVHLVATSGRPVLPANRVSSLTGGGEFFLRQQAARLDQIELSELGQEWQAQIDRFVQVTGRKPDHLDSHHHFTHFSLPIFRLMLSLAGELGCAVRSTLPVRRPGESGGLPRPIYEKMAEVVPALLEESGIRHPDHFEATFYNDTVSPEYLSWILDGLLEGVTELMCHPGYADQDLLGERGSGYNRPRENELATLTDARILELVQHRGIKLISYSELI
jgi:predicted glycoside hydrolase/deacetylase ChbG (UPF0249 family)